MSPKIKAHAGLFLTNLFFAINISAIKYFTTRSIIGPYGLNIIRLGVSIFLFWIIYLFSTQKNKIQKKDILRLVLCGLAALAINQMLFMKGVSLTFPIHASLLLLITPILITFIASYFLKEKVTWLKIIGLILGVSGACILILSGHNTGKGNNVLLGDLLVILSTIAYTIYFILVKPLLQKYPAMDVMRLTFTFGFFMILPIGWKEFSVINLNDLHPLEYVLLFLIVVPGTFLAYIFNVYGIKTLSASTAGTYIYSQPVFAVIISTIFLSEILEPYKIIAGLLIFCGVYLANKNIKNG